MKRHVLIPLFLAATLTGTAQAKDLTTMWGVGFTKAFSSGGQGVSSIAVRYWLDRQLAVEGLAGFQVEENDNAPDTRDLIAGARFLIKMVEEENLHAYGGAGLALLNRKVGNDSDGGVGVNAFAGVEYFFQGLPHLGFSTEIGLGLEDVGGSTRFGTQGESFVNLGMRYYF